MKNKKMTDQDGTVIFLITHFNFTSVSKMFELFLIMCLKYVICVLWLGLKNHN